MRCEERSFVIHDAMRKSHCCARCALRHVPFTNDIEKDRAVSLRHARSMPLLQQTRNKIV
jgi:hypothetical protein